MVKHDGHVHTPFCPHGSSDTLESYIEKAYDLKLNGITFTEHAPLPANFSDPTPDKDSGMRWEDVDTYVEEVNRLKRKYSGKLEILLGFEVDYIEGYEDETKKFLNEYGPLLDDAILSVHFLRKDKSYHCLDYSAEKFQQIVDLFGSVDAVYHSYFETVKKSIRASLGPYKPKRIGHMTLVRKFQKQFSTTRSFQNDIFALLQMVQESNYSLDYNSAGVVKPLCGEPYPDEAIIKQAIQMNIPLVYGSDAHTVKGLLQGSKQLYPNATCVHPITLT